MARGTWRDVPASKRQAARAQWAKVIALGETFCPFCGALIETWQAFDLDHALMVDLDPEGAGDLTAVRPAHRSCNRRAGAVYRNRKRRAAYRAPRCPGCEGPLPRGAGWRLCMGCQAVVDGVA